MQILIAGLGSIGRRHLNNIIGLGHSDISVVTSNKELLKEYPRLTGFDSIQEAVSEKQIDAAVLCTPTAYHVPGILDLLKAGVRKIYIEKPVSHNLEGIEDIEKLAAAYPNKIVVGFDLHFDPGLMKVHELLKAGVIGQVISANAVVGQYLPDWRPHEDYRKGMSAQIKTGGGVMLDLVHEFDYLHWLLGKVEKVGSFNTTSGALEIETEDIAEVILKFKSGALGSIHLDYLQRKLVRNCRITGSEGTIFWDIAATKVSWVTGSSEEFFSYESFNRNDRFIAIMKSFINDDWDERLTSLADGIDSLKMVVAAKESSKKNEIITI